MSEFNELQQVKRMMFSMRNGIIADTLRKNGSPFRIIFGLLLPQLDDIAKNIGHNETIGNKLWENRSTRESMLLAPMLMDPQSFPVEKAIEWASETPTTEVTDILVHKLLRRIPQAYGIAIKMLESEDNMLHYTAMRLLWHQIAGHTAEVEEMAKQELKRNCQLTGNLARQIIEEIEFMRE